MSGGNVNPDALLSRELGVRQFAAKFDFGPYPNVQQWLSRCVGRPAARPPKKS